MTVAQRKSSGTASGQPLLKRGSKCSVRWLDGIAYEAVVLDHRRIASADGNTSAGDLVEYYVHYLGYDTRHDEWIKPEMVVGAATHMSAASASSSSSSAGKSGGSASRATLGRGSNRSGEITIAVPASSVPATSAALASVPHSPSLLLSPHSKQEIAIKAIESVEIGDHVINTWYTSPYPDEYGQASKLYICETCLMYTRLPGSMDCHHCHLTGPPGTQVYHKGINRIFEVDSELEKLYCQNLCLFGKLFLDHKTIFFDITPFLFYVLTETDEEAGIERVVGYFSKERNSADSYNLACIIVFPPYQRHGYGRLLIEFSKNVESGTDGYALSRIQRKPGTPERPLSDLGLATYRNYWTSVLLHHLRKQTPHTAVDIQSLSVELGMLPADIVDALRHSEVARYHRAKNIITIDRKLLEDYCKSKPYRRKLCPASVQWPPKIGDSDEMETASDDDDEQEETELEGTDDVSSQIDSNDELSQEESGEETEEQSDMDTDEQSDEDTEEQSDEETEEQSDAGTEVGSSDAEEGSSDADADEDSSVDQDTDSDADADSDAEEIVKKAQNKRRKMGAPANPKSKAVVRNKKSAVKTGNKRATSAPRKRTVKSTTARSYPLRSRG